MGSTSYDEARDASDPRWAGASWYGPTTGEYWIVNPREYADPRKHGPGYSSRVRSGPATAPVESGGEPPEATSSANEQDREASASASADSMPPSTSAAPSTPFGVHHADPRRANRPPAPSRAGAAQSVSPDSILRAGTGDPLRRIGLVLLAWAPIGIAAAGVIGDVTGCASYSTTCDGTDPFLPWVAQAVIVALLLLIPALARVLAAGGLAVVVGLIPATGLVIAFGGARSPLAGGVLGGVLAIAWLAGVGWATSLLLRGGLGRAGAGPSEPDE